MGMTASKIDTDDTWEAPVVRWSGKKPGGIFSGGKLIVPKETGPEVSTAFAWAEAQLRNMGFTEGHLEAAVVKDFG